MDQALFICWQQTNAAIYKKKNLKISLEVALSRLQYSHNKIMPKLLLFFDKCKLKL